MHYFDRKTWEFRTEPPGARLPSWLILLLAPLLGLLFVVWLPALGFWLVGAALVRRLSTSSA